MNNIFISVIVPFFNEEKHIRKCAESLVNQSLDAVQYELLFIDNDSNDKSKDIVRSFPEVKYLFEPERGRYAARNKGLSVAKGGIIAFTDSDCVVDIHWLKSIYEEFSRNKTQLVLGNNFYSNPKSPVVEFWEIDSNERIKYILAKESKNRYYIYTCNMAITREVFEKVGLFSPVRGEDTEYLVRCLRKFPSLRIKYSETMKTTLLDIDSFYSLLKKRFKSAYIKTAWPHRQTARRQLWKQNKRFSFVLNHFIFEKENSSFLSIVIRFSRIVMKTAGLIGRLMGISSYFFRGMID